MFKLNAKFAADSLFYSLSHFECYNCIEHMLTQWHLPPPLTSTVKSSLFMHMHSNPLPLAARLHQCRTNCSCYINNGWRFSRQTIYIKFVSLYPFFFLHFYCVPVYLTLYLPVFLCPSLCLSLFFFCSLSNPSQLAPHLLLSNSTQTLVSSIDSTVFFFCYLQGQLLPKK